MRRYGLGFGAGVVVAGYAIAAIALAADRQARMATMRTNADDFRARGGRWTEAWRSLNAGCEFPPSLEVFTHELELKRRETPNMAPDLLARRLVESYHRVQGFFSD